MHAETISKAYSSLLSPGFALRTAYVAFDVAAPSVKATEIQSQAMIPAFAASIMDGYAVISSDGPGTYPVVQSSTAGAVPAELETRDLSGAT